MKRLRVFNNLSREKEDFIPFFDEWKKDFVWIYSCGPTVYDDPHFGNLRAMFTADLIKNVIKNLLWYPTKLVSNFTDVGHMVWDWDSGEDKMEKWSRKSWMSARELAKYYENIFRDYSKKLNIEEFDAQPRATEFIKEQMEMVQTLIEKWYTYEIPWDWIYFDTSKVEDYGKLLGPNYKKHLEWISAWERVDCTGKKNPTDFALWKFSPQNEKRQMEWDSPWGMSFPGWHIECSAMSKVYLWDQFDIHHGWYDLIPVHHTNEIVQSECALGVTPWVKYWIHHQFVMMNWEKMSKSTWNFIAPKEMLEKWYTFMDLRYFFLQVHYRSFADFNWDAIQTAKNARVNFMKKLLNLVKDVNYDLSIVEKINSERLNYEQFANKYISTESSQTVFDEMIDNVLDDFNLSALISNINKLLSVKNEESLNIIFYFDKVLLKLDLYKEVVFMLNKEELEANVDIPLDIQDLARARQEAKSNKDFSLADDLRNKVESMWYKIVDNKDWFQIKKI